MKSCTKDNAVVEFDAHLGLAPGTQVDRFVVLHHLGHGGMGVVMAAYDTALQRRVALKLMRPSREPGSSEAAPHRASAEGGLLAEARAMAGLEHPNIVTLHEVGTFRGEAYLVMELVRGTTLARWLGQVPERPWSSILDAFMQAGRGLAYAHDKRVAHGDFKPENLLMDERGRVRISDFGLSRALPIGPVSPGPRGRASMVMGTPRYMAPEQYAGQPADARSDQFAFCVTLYEALYGEHPCVHDTSRSLLELPVEQARKIVPRNTDVPAWVACVLERGLSADPAARFDSMYALLSELTPPARRSTRRVRTAVKTFSVVAACVLAFLVGRDLAGPHPARVGRGIAASLAVPGPSVGRASAAPDTDARPPRERAHGAEVECVEHRGALRRGVTRSWYAANASHEDPAARARCQTSRAPGPNAARAWAPGL